MLNCCWHLWVPERKALGISSGLSLYFLEEEIKDERCKGAYLKVHSWATLGFELPSGHRSHHHSDGGQPARLPHKGLGACLYLPVQVPNFRRYCIILQGGTRRFISLWPVWRHSLEVDLWETFSGGHMLPYQSPDLGEWLMGGSPYNLEWRGLNFLSGCLMVVTWGKSSIAYVSRNKWLCAREAGSVALIVSSCCKGNLQLHQSWRWSGCTLNGVW